MGLVGNLKKPNKKKKQGRSLAVLNSVLFLSCRARLEGAFSMHAAVFAPPETRTARRFARSR
jgi:hypothetical protein